MKTRNPLIQFFFCINSQEKRHDDFTKTVFCHYIASRCDLLWCESFGLWFFFIVWIRTFDARNQYRSHNNYIHVVFPAIDDSWPFLILLFCTLFFSAESLPLIGNHNTFWITRGDKRLIYKKNWWEIVIIWNQQL